MDHTNKPRSSSDSFSSYEEVPDYLIKSEDSDESLTVLIKSEPDNHSPVESTDPVMYRSTTYDEAFSEVGFGLWHILLLIQCGWANASDAVEIMCVSFIIPSIRDDMNISSRDLSGLSISVFLGMMIGGYVWGVLADSIGRRKVIMMSLTMNGIFAVGSAFAKSYPLILAFRLLSGVGVGGSLPVCFSYFTEFQPAARRGSMISALATCWMAGNLLVAGIAWIVLGNSQSTKQFSPFHESWRLFIIVCTIPSFSSVLFFYKMPESPKFLYEKEHYEQSLKVLKKMFYWNQYLSKRPRLFRVDALEPKIVHHLNNDLESISLLGEQRIPSTRYLSLQRNNCCTYFKIKTKIIVISVFRQISEIFSIRKQRTLSSTCLTVVNFTLAFGAYGLIMWMPVLMEKTEKYGHSPCRGNMTLSKVDENESGNATDNVYFDIFIGAAAQLPANILTILLMDFVGAKIFLIFSMFSSSLSVLFFGVVNSRQQILLMSCLFNAVSTVAWNGLDVISMEMFTTDVRSSALGFFTGISRIGSISGNLLFGIFMDINCNVPIFTVASAFLLGTISCLFLPNTRQIHID